VVGISTSIAFVEVSHEEQEREGFRVVLTGTLDVRVRQGLGEY
jgi:hypothetical protein